MKRFLRNLPIKHKLMGFTVAISGVALLLACAAFAISEQAAFRRTMARDFAILADMSGANVAAGMAFNDPVSIEKTLQNLHANPHIIAACAYDREGAVIGTYRRPGSVPGGDFKFPAAQSAGQRFLPGRLDTFKEIELAGEPIGVVYIGTDLSELRERAWRYAAVVCLLLGGCSIVVLLLVSGLQRIVLQPIVDLAQTVAAVTAKKNYTVRAQKQSNDELGRLIDGFNEMLGQIQARDAALQKTHEDLEVRVGERTKELARERARFKFIFDSVQVGFSWMVQNQIATRMVNPAHARITGVPMERCHELELYRLATPADDRARQDALHQLLLAGKIDHYAIEKQYVRSDGSIRWTSLSVYLHRNAPGEDVQEISTLVDITERKQAESLLEETNKRLIDTSRRAGMAEVATGVLHNVGNVLNSVNVSAALIADYVRHTKAGSLAKLAALFEEQKMSLAEFLTMDARGQKIPGYLNVLAKNLAAENEAIVTELEHLQKKIEHIKEIVTIQQSYAKNSGFVETVGLIDLVEDALRMNVSALYRHEVELVRDFQISPSIITDKHKIVQILINLLCNAKQACDETRKTDKRITVRIAGDAQRVQISVSDNGMGILPDNLVRIFGHGFTTKKEGHGFGLHSGALAAKELGGSLFVRSDGIGHGATFTLELPVSPSTPPLSSP